MSDTYTVALNLMSLAFPTIANPIRVDVSTQENPTTIVATQTDTTPLHPKKKWLFAGLPRTNYLVVMNEIDASGNKLNLLADFDVVPDSLYTLIIRQDEQWIVDEQPWFTAGLKTVYFDGGEITPGSKTYRPDYRGWNINPERRNQPGTMLRGREYNWDTVSGKFDMITPGDSLLTGEPFNFDFDPQTQLAGGSTGGDGGDTHVSPTFTNKLITTNYSVSKDDFGSNLIVEPAASYLELTLPPASSVTEGLPLKISVHKTAFCCVKLIGTIVSNFGQSIFLIAGESIEIYCFVRSAGANEYRYLNASGNFGRVGQIVNYDQTSLYNAIRLDGGILSTTTHARLWQYVLSLPANQRIAYASWGGNQTFFSDASGSSFHVPDRSKLYGRVSNSAGGEIAGTKLNAQIAKHKHIGTWGENVHGNIIPPFGSAGFNNKIGDSNADSSNDWWYTNDGSEYAGAKQLNAFGLIGDETRPNSYLINQYVLL